MRRKWPSPSPHLGSKWATAPRNLDFNPYENTLSTANVAGLGPLWSATMSGGGGTPTISAGRVLVGTETGLKALSTITGATLWTAAASDFCL